VTTLDKEKVLLIAGLKSYAEKVKTGDIQAIFCIAISVDGPTQLVLVDPEDRKSLIIAINEEATRMLESPHQLVSLEKLTRFCKEHNISNAALESFCAKEEADGN